jgi:hypothetical protein
MSAANQNTGQFISPSGTSELGSATTETDTAERSISIGKVRQKLGVSIAPLTYPPTPAIITIMATELQSSKIPDGLVNYPELHTYS